MSNGARILVISFSPIHRDSRVLRELSALSQHGTVTTVGYGRMPPYVDEHLEIPESASSLPQTVPGVIKLALRRLESAELAAPATKFALDLIGDRTFDIIVANDARALPLAFAVNRGAPVWADLHEWAPEERTHVMVWKLLVAPLMDHICKKYLPRTSASTTVGNRISQLYEERYGMRPRLLRNAAPFHDLEPTPLPSDGTIRLVHSGAAVFGRDLETTISAVVRADDRFTLDLFLVPANDGGAYLSKLKEIAQDSPRITFHDPVPPNELPETLNAYDVGVFWIPPFNTNARLTLPNKLFDYIQARVAIAVGPSVEMAEIVEQYNIGTVSRDFSEDALVKSLNGITAAKVAEWKQATDLAAQDLSFENESRTISDIISELAPYHP